MAQPQKKLFLAADWMRRISVLRKPDFGERTADKEGFPEILGDVEI